MSRWKFWSSYYVPIMQLWSIEPNMDWVWLLPTIESKHLVAIMIVGNFVPDEPHLINPFHRWRRRTLFCHWFRINLRIRALKDPSVFALPPFNVGICADADVHVRVNLLVKRRLPSVGLKPSIRVGLSVTGNSIGLKIRPQSSRKDTC